ncbi:MAG: hypothetical protein ABIF19_03500 [Planctomycetota bacterium]
MASRRKKLRQEMAKTNNPAIRMQLQELLDKKSQGQSRGIRRAEDALDSLLRQAIDRLPDGAARVLMYVLVTIILLVIFIVLESMA